MDFGRVFERIERVKADMRKKSGVRLSGDDLPAQGPEGQKGETRNIVGAKVGMSGRQYGRAQYIAHHAPTEVIDQLDKGERTIRATYDELKAKEKAANMLPTDVPTELEDDPPGEKIMSAPALPTKNPPKSVADPFKPKRASDVSEEEQMKYLSAHDREVIRKQKEFAALPPEGKIADLERQLFEMRVRANNAESELETLKLEYGIKVDHKDSIIDSLKRQVAELSEALEAAHKRLAELEK
jgi:ParB family chromosome partitioning protein